MKLFITGLNGWVASSLAVRARALGYLVTGSVRGVMDTPGAYSIGTIDQNTDWSTALAGQSVVVHLAARVHVMASDPRHGLAAYRDVNTAGSINLARQAAAAGVRRFVFVSSVKVNGERTLPGRPFRHDDQPAPQDAYGISKREAEDGLRVIAKASDMELVIVRPPLVYGPRAKANFALLVAAVERGLPLPLSGISENRRSLVGIDNLVDLLIECVEHPAAANQTFLVSDGEDLSTASLVRRLARAMDRPARLWSLPQDVLTFGAILLGRRSLAQRLLGSLQLDIRHTQETLGWSPPVSVDDALRRAVKGLGQT